MKRHQFLFAAVLAASLPVAMLGAGAEARATGSSPPALAQPADRLGTQWQTCETYASEVCGTWTRQGTSNTWTARWQNGATASLTITASGDVVTVQRSDPSGLRATYQGTLDGTRVGGSVTWCCDSLGTRSGTWSGTISGATAPRRAAPTATPRPAASAGAGAPTIAPLELPPDTALADLAPASYPLPDVDQLDLAAVERCANTLTASNLNEFDPGFDEILGLCYFVETTPAPEIDPPVARDFDVPANTCFAAGSSVRVSQAEIDEMMAWGRPLGRSDADLKADIEALNRSRGGSGSSTCPAAPSASAGSGSGGCPGSFGDIDTAIESHEETFASLMEELKQLQRQAAFWTHLQQLPELRWAAYILERVYIAGNIDMYDIVTPQKMNRVVDRKYNRPMPYDTDPATGSYIELGPALAAWEASSAGQQAAAEKAAYEVTYRDRMKKVEQWRQLPKDPSEIRQFAGPSQMLDEIAQRQDYVVTALRRRHQDLEVWKQARAGGERCAFATGPLGKPTFRTQPSTGGSYYAFVLDGIGVVVATEQAVAETPACQWTGGGPRPCPGAPPAKELGRLGGPYSSVDAAKADLKTRLECQVGYWGPKAKWGSGWHWLQNNVTTADCKSVQQL